MQDSDQDHYAVLQVHPLAHPDVIQAAYRRLTLLYHPDRNPSPDATQRMVQLNQAYEVLSDPEKRAAYDRSQGGRSSGGGNAGGGSGPPGDDRANPRRKGNNTGFFGLGSTKAEVSKIHGDPHRSRINRSLNRETWFYGRSTVEFSLSSGLVQRWADAGGNLRVRMEPGPNVTSASYFRLGSHKDDVVRLQGSPRRIKIDSQFQET